MKFNVTWVHESTLEIDAADMAAAEEYGRKLVTRLGVETTKLLSIHEIKPTQRKNDKPPTPFNRPPEGTPGGGKIARVAPPVDAVAA